VYLFLKNKQSINIFFSSFHKIITFQFEQKKVCVQIKKIKNHFIKKEMSCSEVDRRVTLLDSILDVVGQTPSVNMSRFAKAAGVPDGVEIVGKCEYLNPGGSVKDRIGRLMVLDAVKRGQLKPGDTLVEATSGNTGIGMSMAAAALGYKMIITMPMKMSQEKQLAIQTLGATVIRTPTSVAYDHPDSLISVARRLVKENPETHHLLDQYKNPSNPLSHELGTGAEIWEQCGHHVDYVVVGTGTGGTISGVGRFLKSKNPAIKVVGVDPVGSILANPDEPAPKVSYQVEGIGYDFVPDVCDRSVVDEWYKSEDKESFEWARLCHRTEGILCGGSCGSVLAAAVQVAKRSAPGTRIVVILADSIRNYLTKFVDDNWMIEKGFMTGEVKRPTYDALAAEVEQLRAKVAELEGSK
jgi:cystathionine beta-synthase